MASVYTNKQDYAVGETVKIAGTDFTSGRTVEFKIINFGADGIKGTGDDINYVAWSVLVGSNGTISAVWEVPEDAQNSKLELTATEDTDGDGVFGGAGDVTATTMFTDAFGSTLSQYANDLDTAGNRQYQTGSLNDINSDYVEGDSIPFRYLIADAQEGGRVHLDIVYQFTNTAGDNTYDFLTSDNASVTLTDAIRFGANSASIPAGFGLTSSTNLLNVAIPDDPNITLDTGGNLRVASNFGVSLVSVSAPTILDNGIEKKISLILDLGSDGDGTLKEGNVDLGVFWGGHLARDNQYAGPDNGAADAPGASFHMKGEGFVDNDGNGTKNAGDDDLGAGDRSLQGGVVVETSLAWEKRAADTNALQGGATFTVTPDPTTGTGSLTVVDDTDGVTSDTDIDRDPNAGQLLLNDLKFGTYTITETVAPAGYSLDPDATRVQTITNTAPNAVVGTQGTNDPGATDESDFHNPVAFVPAPAIQVVKTAGNAVDGTTLTTLAGDVVYHYVVTNTGDVALSDVTVVDDRGTAATGDDVTVGTIASLAAGASQELTATINVTSDTTNVATATGTTPLSGTVSDTDDAVVDVIHPAIQVVKTAGTATDGATLQTLGGDVVYHYAVTNTGDVALSDVTVVDDRGTAATGDDVTVGTIASLAAGASQELTATINVTSDTTNVATATGTTPLSGTVSDTDDAVVDVIHPAIQVVKTAGTATDGATLQTLGGDVVYHYAVTNTGDVALSDVTVVDDRGTAATGDDVTVGTIASLAAGASQELTATINVTSDTTNVATATGTTPLSGTVSDTDDAVVDVIHPAIQVVKTAGTATDGATLQTLGGDVVYHYAVTNTGDVALSDVTVVDDRGTAATGDDVTVGTIASLAAGASQELTATINVTSDTTNVATATGTTPLSGTVSDTDDAVVDVIHPAIQVVKTAGTATDGATLQTLGGDVVYHYAVTNTGDVALSDVTVVDDRGTAATGDDVTVGTIASLAAGASQELTATINVTSDTTNVATATGTTPLSGTVSDTDDAVVDVIHPAIQVVKTAGTATDGATLQTLGGDVVYHYAVTNTGDVALSDVTVVDDRGTAATGDDVTVGTIASLAAGASQELTATINVTSDTTNVATATGTTPLSGTVSDTDDAVVDVIHPAIQVVKTAGTATDGATLQTLGGDVVYHYAVTNTGDVALSDVTVVDDRGTAATGDDVTVGTIASLAAGASQELTATINVTSDTTNVATATGTTPLSGTVSDTDDAVVDVIHPAIQVVKTAGTATDGATLQTLGGDVVYHYAVTNTGDVALSDVTVVDDRGTAATGDDVTVGTIASLAAGASQELTATINVTSDTTNVATATGTTPLSGTVSDTDDAVVDVFAKGVGGLTPGFWGQHIEAWDGVLANNDKTQNLVTSGVLSDRDAILYGSSLSLADLNGDGTVNTSDKGVLLGDTNGDGVRGNDGANNYLFVSLAAAQQIILSSETSIDTRQILMKHALATQLNINNGDIQPKDLIGEAVQWLKGQSPYTYTDGSSGQVDTNGNGVLESTEYNTTTKAFTFDANGSTRTGNALTSNLQAWQKDVDVDSTSVNVQANGQDLKNALMYFNQDQLVTVNGGSQVGFTADHVSLIGVPQNNVEDAFWGTLQTAGIIS